MKFTRNDDCPEEPGYYWFRKSDWNDGIPFIIELFHSPNPPSFTGERIISMDGEDYHIDYDDAELFEGGEWSGPIQEPDE